MPMALRLAATGGIDFSLARSPSKDRDLMRLIGTALFVRRWRAPLFPGKPLSSCHHEGILFTLTAEGKSKILMAIGARQNSPSASGTGASRNSGCVVGA